MARSTRNLNLRVWDQANDLFNYTELATNLDTLDAHDHSTNPIPNSGLGVGAVRNINIQNLAINRSKIADNAVGTTQLASGAVQSGNIANGAVQSQHLRPTAGGVFVSGTTTLTASPAALPGASVTLSITAQSIALVTCVFNFFLDPFVASPNKTTATGQLYLDGSSYDSANNGAAFFKGGEGRYPDQATVAQTYAVQLPVGIHVLSLQASKDNGNATAQANLGTRFTYLVVST